MEIQVFDTYVKNANDEEMHFDVLLPKGKILVDALKAAKEYLKGTTHGDITSKECSFCHVQEANTEQEQAVTQQGYFIIKMSDNCP